MGLVLNCEQCVSEGHLTEVGIKLEVQDTVRGGRSGHTSVISHSTLEPCTQWKNWESLFL